MIKGKIAFYCDVLDVTRQGFYWYLKHRDDPWKYENIAEKMRVIVEEDECNDTYERCRMNQALKLKYPNEDVPAKELSTESWKESGLAIDQTVNPMALQRPIATQESRRIF